MLHTPAIDKGAGHTSCGVAIFARHEVGLRLPTGKPAQLHKHRMLAVRVDLQGWPQMDLVGAYFKVSEGLGPVNSKL